MTSGTARRDRRAALLEQHEAWRAGQIPRRPNLTGLNLSGWDLSSEDLSGALLDRAQLVRADLESALLDDARLVGANLAEAKLSDSSLHRTALGEAVLRGAELVGAALHGASLHGADMRDVDAAGADFDNTDLRKADLRGANLRSAGLRGADLRGACLLGASWRDPDITDLGLTKLEGAVFMKGLIVPAIPALPQRILDLLSAGGTVKHWGPRRPHEESLEGWAIRAAQGPGCQLKETVGKSVAGALLFHASLGDVPLLDREGEDAVQWLVTASRGRTR